MGWARWLFPTRTLPAIVLRHVLRDTAAEPCPFLSGAKGRSHGYRLRYMRLWDQTPGQERRVWNQNRGGCWLEQKPQGLGLPGLGWEVWTILDYSLIAYQARVELGTVTVVSSLHLKNSSDGEAGVWTIRKQCSAELKLEFLKTVGMQRRQPDCWGTGEGGQDFRVLEHFRGTLRDEKKYQGRVCLEGISGQGNSMDKGARCARRVQASEWGPLSDWMSPVCSW